MIIKIQPGLIKKALPNGGTLVRGVKGRPNLSKLNLAKVEFREIAMTSSSMPWKELVSFMDNILRKGFLVLGSREWIAICCDPGVRGWLAEEPTDSPWKFGNGGLIGFPNGLLKMEGEDQLSYDTAIWISKEKRWHVRVFKNDDEKIRLPKWYSFLRLAIYPLN